jgi:hypothetical protein
MLAKTHHYFFDATQTHHFISARHNQNQQPQTHSKHNPYHISNSSTPSTALAAPLTLGSSA